MKTLILIIIFMFMWILGIVVALMLVNMYINFFWNKTEEPKVSCFVILLIGAILAAILFFKNYDWISELIMNILKELEEAK